MSALVDSIAALEGVIGKTPPAIHLKVIDHLDETALAWLESSPLMFAGFREGPVVSASAAGGAPGFAKADARTLRLPLSALDDASLARVGAGFGSLFLVPGIGETLRVNGHIREVTETEALVEVAECYVHCAKALIRSDFWAAPTLPDAPADAAGFVAASRFMALATSDAAGGTDLSPKGDPAGRMARLEGDSLLFAERPGNKRADGFRNMIAQPQMAALMLVPGSTRLAIISGKAALTTDAAALAPFTVRDKVPILATRVTELRVQLIESEALQRAKLWPATAEAGHLQPAKMLIAHMKINKDKGLAARLASSLVSIPGLMQKGLDKDYKTNLY